MMTQEYQLVGSGSWLSDLRNKITGEQEMTSDEKLQLITNWVVLGGLTVGGSLAGGFAGRRLARKKRQGTVVGAVGGGLLGAATAWLLMR